MILTERLINVLSEINSNISENIKSNLYKFDFMFGYIDISTEKDDVVRFLPKDKLKNVKFKFNKNSTQLNKSYQTLINEIGFKCKVTDHDFTNEEFNIIETKLSDRHDSYVFHLIENGVDSSVIYGATRTQNVEPVKINLQEIKVGRFVRNLLNITGLKHSEKDLENFVTHFSSIIKIHRNMINDIEIVKGEDIRNWYFLDNYYNSNGQLGSSCMRYKNTQDYLDIYVNNKNCNLLILKKDNKLIARSLLWRLDDGSLYMDRQYTNDDSIASVFKLYAEINSIKYFDSYLPDTREPKIIHNQEVIDNDISITLEKYELDLYPYLDTFRYMKDNKLYTKNRNEIEYDLSQTNGTRIKLNK